MSKSTVRTSKMSNGCLFFFFKQYFPLYLSSRFLVPVNFALPYCNSHFVLNWSKQTYETLKKNERRRSGKASQANQPPSTHRSTRILSFSLKISEWMFHCIVVVTVVVVCVCMCRIFFRSHRFVGSVPFVLPSCRLIYLDAGPSVIEFYSFLWLFFFADGSLAPSPTLIFDFPRLRKMKRWCASVCVCVCACVRACVCVSNTWTLLFAFWVDVGFRCFHMLPSFYKVNDRVSIGSVSTTEKVSDRMRMSRVWFDVFQLFFLCNVSVECHRIPPPLLLISFSQIKRNQLGFSSRWTPISRAGWWVVSGQGAGGFHRCEAIKTLVFVHTIWSGGRADYITNLTTESRIFWRGWWRHSSSCSRKCSWNERRDAQRHARSGRRTQRKPPPASSQLDGPYLSVAFVLHSPHLPTKKKILFVSFVFSALCTYFLAWFIIDFYFVSGVFVTFPLPLLTRLQSLYHFTLVFNFFIDLYAS